MINKQYEKDSSGAVFNNDISQFERYKLQRQKIQREKSLEQRIEFLEKELDTLKKTISQLIG